MGAGASTSRGLVEEQEVRVGPITVRPSDAVDITSLEGAREEVRRLREKLHSFRFDPALPYTKTSWFGQFSTGPESLGGVEVGGVPRTGLRWRADGDPYVDPTTNRVIVFWDASDHTVGRMRLRLHKARAIDQYGRPDDAEGMYVEVGAPVMTMRSLRKQLKPVDLHAETPREGEDEDEDEDEEGREGGEAGGAGEGGEDTGEGGVRESEGGKESKEQKGSNGEGDEGGKGGDFGVEDEETKDHRKHSRRSWVQGAAVGSAGTSTECLGGGGGDGGDVGIGGGGGGGGAKGAKVEKGAGRRLTDVHGDELKGDDDPDHVELEEGRGMYVWETPEVSGAGEREGDVCMGDARGNRLGVRMEEMRGRCVCHGMVGRGRTGERHPLCERESCVCLCVEQCYAYTPVMPWNV
jgi:hypothetical protein